MIENKVQATEIKSNFIPVLKIGNNVYFPIDSDNEDHFFINMLAAKKTAEVYCRNNGSYFEANYKIDRDGEFILVGYIRIN